MDSAEAYEVHAHEFLEGRDKSEIGMLVAERWCRALGQGAKVIELACGGGYVLEHEIQVSDPLFTCFVSVSRHGVATGDA